MFKDKKLISIIIPVYNRLDYITRCLKSIHSQSFTNYETIVIDDNSAEDLKEIESLCDKYIRNVVSLGPAYSRNLGALNSSGKILLFMDSDTTLLSGTLEKLPGIFEIDSFIGAVGGSGPPDHFGKDVKYVSGMSYNRFGQSHITRYDTPKEERPFKFYDCHHLESAFLAVRRDIFERIGGFDPYFFYMGEDRDLCLRIKDAGYRVVVSLETRAIHYRTSTDNHFKDSNGVYDWMYLQKRFIQVAIKRNGFWGGILWLYGNRRKALNRYFFPSMAKQFKLCNQLTARRETNFLESSQIDKFYFAKTTENLQKHRPFSISFPLPTPRNIVLFITSQCNAHCEHCFLPVESKVAQRNISKESIRKIFLSLNQPASVSLTGGEPFLRNDLMSIVDESMNLRSIRSVNILSNGSMPKEIERICKKISKNHRKPLFLQLSLDGLASTHDNLRKIPDGFDKVIDACERAKNIQQKTSNFSYIVSITVMRQNISEINELIDYLQERGYPSKITLVRGNSFSTFRVPRDILNQDYEPCVDSMISIDEIEKLIKRISEKHPMYFNDFQKQKLQIMLQTLKQKRGQIDCYAGYEDVVIYNDGSIGICEQDNSFGNL